MLDLEKIPPHILESLRKRGLSDDRIRALSPQSAFDEHCNWMGLPGRGLGLFDDVEALKKADLASGDFGKMPTQDVRRLLGGILMAVNRAHTAVMQADSEVAEIQRTHGDPPMIGNRKFTPEQIEETLFQAKFHEKNGNLVNPKVLIKIIESLQGSHPQEPDTRYVIDF